METATIVDHAENCDLCLRKGIQVRATHDAPTPGGCWAFVCGACLYRLPAPNRAVARPLAAVSA